MANKWKLGSCVFAFLLLVSASSGLVLANVVLQVDQAEYGTVRQISIEREDRAGRVSWRLCGTAVERDRGSYRAACGRLAAGVLTEEGVIAEMDGPQHTALGAIESSVSAGSAIWMKSDFGADHSVTNAEFEGIKANYDDRSLPLTDAELTELSSEPDDLSTVSSGNDAIPGSLLVTILALVGIVAVARRDVSGRDARRPVVDSDVEVARITSLRHDTSVMDGRLREQNIS